MRPILFEGAARRWSLGAALLATLTILLINFAPSITAQDNPRPPHWFWGNDLDSYVGDQVVAINQDGAQVGSTTVESRGEWTVTVSPEDARTVTLRLISDSGTRATDPLDVMDGGFDAEGLSISDFRHRISEELGGSDATIAVRIIADAELTTAESSSACAVRTVKTSCRPPASSLMEVPDIPAGCGAPRSTSATASWAGSLLVTLLKTVGPNSASALRATTTSSREPASSRPQARTTTVGCVVPRSRSACLARQSRQLPDQTAHSLRSGLFRCRLGQTRFCEAGRAAGFVDGVINRATRRTNAANGNRRLAGRRNIRQRIAEPAQSAEQV